MSKKDYVVPKEIMDRLRKTAEEHLKENPIRDSSQQNTMKYIEYLYSENKDLQGKVLKWYQDNGRDPKFAEYFGIESHTQPI